MKYKHLIIVLYTLIISCMISCKKYPSDNSLVHFKSVRGRLTGKLWDNYLYNTISFGRDGGFTGRYPPFFCEDGSWDFVDKRDRLRITDKSGQALEYTILRLDHDALYLKNDTIMFYFRVKD